MLGILSSSYMTATRMDGFSYISGPKVGTAGEARHLGAISTLRGLLSGLFHGH